MTKAQELNAYVKQLKKKYKKKVLHLYDLTDEEKKKYYDLVHDAKREQISKQIDESRMFKND